jgi:hypothetical protein
VLWGEAFKRNNYFNSSNDAQLFRDALLAKDKDSDSIYVAKSNIGSKIDFIRLIKSLSDESDVKIIDYDKDFVDLINDNLDVVQPKFIKDMEKIALSTSDLEMKKSILNLQMNFKKLQKEKDEALEAARAEEIKRSEAEAAAIRAEGERAKAERKAKEYEEQRRIAESEKIKAENEKIKAENEKLKAEKLAMEEASKRVKAESIAKKREEQVKRCRAAQTIEYEDLRDSNHIVGVFADDISKKILLLKRKIDKNKILSKADILNWLKGVSFVNDKISTLTRFTTKSNFLKAALAVTDDIVQYLYTYLHDIYSVYYPNLKIDVITNGISLIKVFEPIEFCTAIDNIISNSRKKNATRMIFEFYSVGECVYLSIRDVGKRLETSIADPKMIFEEGITTTNGAGLGLSHVKRIVEDKLKGTIEYNPDYKKGFELIIKFLK